MLERTYLINASEVIFYPYDSKRVLDQVASVDRDDRRAKKLEEELLERVTSKYIKYERRFEDVNDDNRPTMDNKVVFEVRLKSGAVVYYWFYDFKVKVGLTLADR